MENQLEYTSVIEKLARKYEDKFHRLEYDDLRTLGMINYERRKDKYDPEKSRFKTYIYVITRNYYNDLMKHQVRRKRYQGKDLVYENVSEIIGGVNEDVKFYEEAEHALKLEIIEKNLPYSEWCMLTDYLNGMNWKSIGDKYGYIDRDIYQKKGLIMKKCRNIMKSYDEC